MMDEQRTWLKARRKRRLRILAVMLSLCVLFTTYPDIPAALSVFASEEQAQSEVRYISGFTALPDEIREQTVPIGTEREELALPDTLEAVVTERQSEDTAEKSEDDGKEEPGENDGKKPDGDTTGTENQDGSTGGPEEGGPSGTEKDNTETGGETGDHDTKTGDGVDAQPGADGESEETDETAGTDATDNGDTVDIQKEENTGESAPAEEQPESAPAQETHTVTMAEYYAENVISVQTLESTQTGAGAADQTAAQETRVTIENVIWESDPAYDGSVEEVYTFTAVLPEGYALSEGVSLPQITVTVGSGIDAVIQTLLDRIAALPDAQEYMEKEPDIDNWEGDEDDYEEAYTEWMEGLQEYAGEALAILEEIEKLTEEEQALLPQEALEKLAAWVEIAEQLGVNAMTMAAAAHTCNGITFTAWTSTSSLPTSGNYYLAYDVTLDKSTVYHISGTLNLCLNGKKVIGADRESKAHIFQIDGGTLNLYDCVGTGRVYGTGTNGFGVIVIGTNGTFNVYGGQTEGGGGNSANVSISGEGSTVGVYGGSVGSIVGTGPQNASVLLYGGTIETNAVPISVQNNITVTIAGNAEVDGHITTSTSIVAQGAGVSGLNAVYYIAYRDVTDGTIVVRGSTDRDHYRYVNDRYALVPEGGNLVARKNCTVTYYTNGGTIAEESKYTSYVHGTGLTLPTPTRPGYTFTGWYTNPDFSGTPVTSIPTADMDNKSYYAKWTGNTYSITYAGLDGADTFTPKPTAHINGTATQIGNPTRTGYIFAGWTVDDSSTKKKNLTLSGTYTEAIHLTAMWWAADSARTVTYHTNGGKISNESNYTTYYEGEGMWLPEPTKSGYVFFGWYENADFSGNKVEKISASDRGNKTYYARWADSFDIRYHQNGGNGSSSGSYTYGTGLKLPTPTRSGYGFFGWYESDDFSGDRVAEISATETGDKEYWALWKKPSGSSGPTTSLKTYLITYHKNGGTMIDKESEFAAYFEKKGLERLPKIKREGYTFGGWRDRYGSVVESISRLKNEDMDLYAEWTPTPYNITYNLDGGELPEGQSNPQKYNIESNAITLYNPTKTGYTFAGWSGTDLTGSSNKRVTIAQGSMGNRSYTANWSTDTYTISYNLNGGALQSGQGNPTEYNVESNAITLHNPTKTGYTFAGWSGTGLSGNNNTSVTIAQGCTGNRTYTAEWTPNTYTVAYNGNGSTGGSTANSTHTYGTAKALTANGYKKEYMVTFNHNYTGSSNATKTAAYTFAGWHTNADGSGTSYSDKASVSNLTSTNNGTVTLYAKWTSASISYKPTRAGYTFAGWYADSGCGGSRADSDGTYTPTGNQTLYACWKEATPPDKPGSSADLPTGWTNTQPTIPLTLSDNEGVKELWVSIDGGDYTKVSDFTGDSQTVTYDYTVSEEGDHTYRFTTKDAAGNVSPESDSFRVKLDTTVPVIGTLTCENITADSADVTFTPSEGGKVYWILDPAGTPADAQAVVSGAQGSAQGGTDRGGVEDITGDTSVGITVTGLTPGAAHKVYVVLEDAAGNLSAVKEAVFGTLPEAPEITLNDLVKDYEKEKIKIPDIFGDVEVYTAPNDPSGSKIQSEADGYPVEPGKPVYIRYPEKTQDGVTVPASDGVKIDIPGRPVAPAPKQVTVTDNTVKVIGPSVEEEYILVEKGSLPEGAEPDWNDADKVNENGEFTGLDPNKEYDLYVRKKATKDDFASESAKTPVRTWVTIYEPQITGDGAGKTGNTAPKPEKPDEGGATVTYTGTYEEEYTPVIIVDGKEIIPGAGTPGAEGSEMTWDEKTGKGGWKYVYPIPDGATEADITVAFRKRAVTGITATPGSLTLSADSDVNRSAAEAGEIAPLTAYLKEKCSVKAAYDNRTTGAVPADDAAYAVTDTFAPKGAAYHYTISAGGKTCTATLTVTPVTASVRNPDTVMQRLKDEGYTAQEAGAWLPAKLTVTYTGADDTSRTEDLAVTWNTGSIGNDFGKTLGEKTVNGTVDLPAWATGQASVSIVLRFVDKTPLGSGQIQFTMQDFRYGDKKLPDAQGSITVTDTNPVYTYLYSTNGGTTWVAEENLPKSDSGYIVPGEYQVKITYTGDTYTGEKTASFTVAKKQLEIRQGTLAAKDKNYDGTLTAALTEDGRAELPGVVGGDKVMLGGTLEARFTGAGPKKNIPVTVTGFLLEGADSRYYELNNTAFTLYATINNADGTPPAEDKKPDYNKQPDDDKQPDDGKKPDDDKQPDDGTKPDDSKQPDDGKKPVDGKKPDDGKQPDDGTKPGDGMKSDDGKKPVDGKKPDEEKKVNDGTKPDDGAKPGDGSTLKEDETKIVPAVVEDGRIVIDGGNHGGGAADPYTASTMLNVGEGAVIVRVVCEEPRLTAGVADTVAVANAVLTTEQIQLVNSGDTIEIRVEVKDITQSVSGQDQEAIESAVARLREEQEGMTLGMYVDISMFVKVGEGEWNAVTRSNEPVEVVIGIPEELRADGREYYIIRSHEGECDILVDMDDAQDTITISTDRFSAYAIAYEQTDGTGMDGTSKCGLCHICPTFLGICCFIWLAVIIAVIVIVILLVLRRKKEEESEGRKS